MNSTIGMIKMDKRKVLLGGLTLTGLALLWINSVPKEPKQKSAIHIPQFKSTLSETSLKSSTPHSAREKIPPQENVDLVDAWRELDRDNWVRAEQILEELLKKEKTPRVMYELMLIKSNHREDQELALEYCLEIIKLAPETPYIFEKVLELAKTSQLVDRTLIFLQEHFPSSSPYYIDSQETLAQLYQSQESHMQAIQQLKRAIDQSNHPRPRLWSLMASSHLALGEHEKRVIALENELQSIQKTNAKVAMNDPKNQLTSHQTERKLIDAYQRIESLHKAKRLITKHANLDPSDESLARLSKVLFD